ncbi:MAG: hypothetical protein QF464_01915, partial [Myxococcota bacterium]|nr:hypothetical protein [Myxococcota bacterium]
MTTDETLALPRKPRRGDIVDLAIAGLDEQARGEARVRVRIGPGGPPRTLRYAVRRALPGERVLARVRRTRGGRLEASVQTLVSPAANRIPARCAHFDDSETSPGCGGCALQSLTYEDQLIHKAERVANLVRGAGVDDASIGPAIPTDSPWYYRNKMEFSFGREADGAYALGMHPAGRRYDVLRLEACYLQSEGSAALVRAVRAWGEEHGVAHHDERRETGLLRTLTIREGKRTGERMVEITTSPTETV